MGTESKERPQLYANVCGEWKPVPPIDATPSLDAASSWVDVVEVLAAPPRIRGKLPKYFRCRSRKRLKKLMMANKLSRDEAERIARQVCSAGLSYREAWRQLAAAALLLKNLYL